MSEKIEKQRKTIRTDELEAMSPQEVEKFFAENPDSEIDIPDDWWENATWTYSKDNPSKILCVSGPAVPEKVEK